MPAVENGASLTAIGGDVQHGPAAFTTTHWSVLLEAQGESPAAQEALEKLCRTYWRPIYGFVRRQGARSEDAEEATGWKGQRMALSLPLYITGIIRLRFEAAA